MGGPIKATLLAILSIINICQATRLLQPVASLTNKKYLPIVIWHGMGDSCCSEGSLGAVQEYIEHLLGKDRVFVYSIATGRDAAEDVLSSYFGRIDDQVGRVCDELRSIPELQGGYIGLGFSQGGQFMRAVVQRCQHRGPSMHSLITMGSQHQGIMDVPGCWEPSFNITPSWGCRLMQQLLGSGAYIPWVQSRSIQAQYFKDPARLESYALHSDFLADVNAEAAGTSPSDPTYRQYKDNLASLQRLVLFQFDNDVTVVPKESAQFGFFDGERLIPLRESALYLDAEDRLGLRSLDERGRLVFASAPGFHMQFSLEWFGEYVVRPYLAVEVPTEEHAFIVAS